MDKVGLTQSEVAKRLEVSREAVSQWFRHTTFPRPDKLLKLAKLLNLSFNELVIREEKDAPVVAYRRVRASKTKDHHIEKAQHMGRLLRQLVPFLPFDSLEVPPVLKDPHSEYAYIQQVVAKVRQDILADQYAALDFHQLIRRFLVLQAVLIPVLWGARQHHGNALHVFLPDSKTTWVYLNLDVNIHDFKFWMAHELGHCMAPALRGDEGEDFADAFAGALLFPREKAELAYTQLKRLKSAEAVDKRLLALAEEEIISPYTILTEVNHFAVHHGMPEIEKSPDFFRRLTIFNQQYPNVSSLMLEAEPATAAALVEKSSEALETPFFSMLRSYLQDTEQGYGFVQTVMDLPLLDAKGIHAELS